MKKNKLALLLMAAVLALSMVVLIACTNTCTVTFDTDGGSAIETQTVQKGEYATRPSDPVKTGYVFNGWCKEDGTTPFVFEEAVTENLTVYAQWAAKTVNISFDTDGKTTNPASVTRKFGEAYGVLPTLSVETYEFLGWSTDGTQNGLVNADSIVDRESVTLHALFELSEDAVKIVFDYGTYAAGKTIYVMPDTRISFLDYWVLTGDEMTVGFVDGQDNEYALGDTFVVADKDVTFTATFEQSEFLLEYDVENSGWEICGLSTVDTNNTTINVPTTLYGIKVTRIADRAFANLTHVTSILLGEEIVCIGKEAFANTSILSINLPDSVEEVGEVLLGGCSKLESISLPFLGSSRDAMYDKTTVLGWYFGIEESTSQVQKEGFIRQRVRHATTSNTYSYVYAFYPENLDTVEIRGGIVHFFAGELMPAKHLVLGDVTEICSYAFRYAAIEDVTFTDFSFTVIGDFAFSHCESLLEVEIPDGVTYIGRGVFCDCISLKSATMPDSVLYADGELFAMDSMLESATLSDNLEGISYNLFIHCTSLVKFNVPSRIAYVGSRAFESTCIPAITLPDTVMWIGVRAFAYSTAFTEIVIPEYVYEIGEYAFWHAASLADVTFLGNDVVEFTPYIFSQTAIAEIQIPENVRVVNSYAFYRCELLKEVYIHDNITAVGYSVFEFCESLERVTFGENTKIDRFYDNLFANCTSLSDITIPETVTTLGEKVFLGCSSLRMLVIPTSVKTIQGPCFVGCVYILIISAEAEKPEGWAEDWNTSELSNVFVGAELRYTDEFVYAVKQEKSYVIAHIYGNDDVTVPGKLGGYDVVEIGEAAFEYDYAMTSLYIEEGVETIAFNAFKDCRYLVDARLPEGLVSMEEGAFYSCWKLETINLPTTLVNIGKQAFQASSPTMHTKLSEGQRPSTWDANNALSGKTIVWSSSLEDMKEFGIFSYFDMGDYIKIVNVPKDATPDALIIPSEIDNKPVKELGDQALYNCSPRVIWIPDSVEVFGNRCFSGFGMCLAFQAMSQPEGFTTSCFSDASQMERFTLRYGCTQPKVDKDTQFVYVTTADGRAVVVGIDSASTTLVAIPEKLDDCTVDTISSCAFYYNKDFTSMLIPETVTHIGYWAFYNTNAGLILYCNAPESAYNNTSGLYGMGGKIYYNVDVKVSGDFQYIVENGKATVTCYTGTQKVLEFPAAIDGVKIAKIGDKAFYVDVVNHINPAYSLRILRFAEGSELEEIGTYAFHNCEYLSKVYIIPKTVTTIGANAFSTSGGAMRDDRNANKPYLVMVFEGNVVGKSGNYLKYGYAYGANDILSQNADGEMTDEAFWIWFNSRPYIEENND